MNEKVLSDVTRGLIIAVLREASSHGWRFRITVEGGGRPDQTEVFLPSDLEDLARLIGTHQVTVS